MKVVFEGPGFRILEFKDDRGDIPYLARYFFTESKHPEISPEALAKDREEWVKFSIEQGLFGYRLDVKDEGGKWKSVTGGYGPTTDFEVNRAYMIEQLTGELLKFREQNKES